MFENSAVLPRLGELLSVAGIDGIVVGPRDLAHSSGRTGRPEDPVVQAAIDEAGRTTEHLVKWAALPGNTPSGARASRERGGHIFLTYLPAFVASVGAEFLRAAGRR